MFLTICTQLDIHNKSIAFNSDISHFVGQASILLSCCKFWCYRMAVNSKYTTWHFTVCIWFSRRYKCWQTLKKILVTNSATYEHVPLTCTCVWLIFLNSVQIMDFYVFGGFSVWIDSFYWALVIFYFSFRMIDVINIFTHIFVVNRTRKNTQ